MECDIFYVSNNKMMLLLDINLNMWYLEFLNELSYYNKNY